jgi:DNA polymerase I
MEAPTNPSDTVSVHPTEEVLFGWDPTPGIVSIWASRSGKAWIWQRMGDRVHCTRETFRPWLFATTLDDLAHLGSALQLQ